MLMCRVEINNYCIRKDKVMQLKARIEIQFAKETIGKGGGVESVIVQDKRSQTWQIVLLLVDRANRLLKNAYNLIILK